MAGRLRTQLKVLLDLSWAVHDLSERVSDAAPDGIFTDENFLKRLRGEPLDEKSDCWHDARDGITDCDWALIRLHELLEERIRELPTYRPPLMLEASAESSPGTAEGPPEGVSGDAIPDTPANG